VGDAYDAAVVIFIVNKLEEDIRIFLDLRTSSLVRFEQVGIPI